MRDRLRELLKQLDFDYGEECVLAAEGEGYKCAPDFAEYFADHLLANGVIVPPVKIGQTIYRMNIYNDAYREATVVAIYYAEDKKYHPKPHILVHHGDERGRLRINFSDFGKTVFLTKEEAEKALAEIEGKK